MFRAASGCTDSYKIAYSDFNIEKIGHQTLSYCKSRNGVARGRGQSSWRLGPPASRLADEDEAGPQGGVFRKREESSGGGDAHAAGPQIAQHPQLRCPQRAAAVPVFQVCAIKLRHQKFGGFVGDVPQGGDDSRSARINESTGQADDAVAGDFSASADVSCSSFFNSIRAFLRFSSFCSICC